MDIIFVDWGNFMRMIFRRGTRSIIPVRRAMITWHGQSRGGVVTHLSVWYVIKIVSAES